MRTKAMNFRNFAQNFLIDNERGMQNLNTWFLNELMNEEMAHQAADYLFMQGPIHTEHTGTGTGNKHIKTGLEKSDS